MKKIALLLIAGAFAVGASAQYQQRSDMFKGSGRQRATIAPVSNKVNKPNYHNLAKTTGVPFYTENFSSGTNNTMPTGWSAGMVAGSATWKWRNVACTGPFAIPAIASTTAANGWMVYDSDSIGFLTHAASLEGWLQSPSIVCTGHASVGLTFQEWFRAFNDSCFVQVSNNNGASWVDFPLTANNNLSNNDFLSSNPFIVHLNISSVAANQANVKIRFRYKYAGPIDGGYNWLVDDVNLAELDPVELAISKSFVIGAWGRYDASVATVPLQFVDSLLPIALISNNGSNAQTNIPLSANIYRNGTSVYTKNVTFPALPVSGEDSLVNFVTPYLPNAIGNYVVAYNVSQAGDADLTNNRDTTFFNVNDTLWSQNAGLITGSFDIHRPASGGNPEVSAYFGTRFDVPDNQKDTITAITVAFASNTDAGSTVRVHIYKAKSAGWEIQAASQMKTLTAADISTTTTTVYTRFYPDLSGGGSVSDFILDSGSYAVVVAGHQVAPGNEVSVLSSSPSEATLFAGFFGQSDDAPNDANVFDFGATFFTGVASIPLVRLHFGNASKLGVENTLVNLAGNAYPNPVNNTVNIPFSVKQDANVTIEISNVVGQVVKSHSVGAVPGNQTREAVLSTTDLTNGMYIYTIKANGQRASGKFVVTH